MSFSITTNPQGDSRIDEISRRQSRSVRQTGLLGVMQDRAYISAYRGRALNLEPTRSRARAYVSYNQAYKNADRKQASIRQLRVSQSSCSLQRCLKAVGARISCVQDIIATQLKSASVVSG